MTRNYIPRRASKRWLAGAPAYVLDVLDHPDAADRYTVLFTFPLAYVYRAKPGGGSSMSNKPGDFAETYITGLSTSENGHVSGSIELKAYEAANYRYRQKHRRIRWADLPEATRRFVQSYAERD